MKKSKVLKILNKHLSDSTTTKDNRVRPVFTFSINGKDLEVSIQASENHYCAPKEDNADYYECVELGYPNFLFSREFIAKYADDIDNPKDTIYGYVPLKELAKELSKLGIKKNKKKHYTKVRLIVHDNTIFIIDNYDRDNYIAINPEYWEEIKENIDQQIESGYLEDTDK